MIGRQIGPYKVGRLIGKGGMGIVYEAVHERFGQRAAVKTLKPEFSENVQYRERFLREARACSKVAHPGLALILDCGELDDGQLFILMEYLDGVTLRERLKLAPSQRLAVEPALRLVQQVAAAMDVAHKNGIVHRDLKPDNIMLIADGAATLGERAKILDFGIAKFIGAAALPTLATTGIVGTPTYMSPERCRNDDNVDGKSDVYALGCMFYELLCGRPPFDDSPDALLRQHVYGKPVSPRLREPAIPPAVEALIERMLEKTPEVRPEMADVAAEIDRLLSNPRRLRASPLVAWLGRRLSPRRPGTRIALIAGMLLLLILLALLFSMTWPALIQQTSEMARIEERARIKGTALPALVPQPSKMASIEGGDFMMGIDNQQYDDAVRYVRSKGYKFYSDYDYLKREQPQHRVRLSSFLLDVTEVTNEQFADWLNKLQSQGRIRVENKMVSLIIKRYKGDEFNELYNLSGNSDSNGLDYMDYRFRVLPGTAHRPVNAVTWEGANEYCQDAQKRLPTEAEWEFAARSRGKYLYPWGNTRPTCGDIAIERGPTFGACKAPERIGLPDVGSTKFDQTEQGVYDMAGNVSEWVDDWLYHYMSCDPFCLNPRFGDKRTDLKNPERRVVRGGAWSMDFPSARATGRISMKDSIDAATGFRCARQIE